MLTVILIIIGVIVTAFVIYDTFIPKKESPGDKIPWNDEARAERRILVAQQEAELLANPEKKKELIKKHEQELEDFADRMNEKFSNN